eukprot:GHVU01150926.1.p1 GENE.GHVU01150926.1~~GHVU01150926.1.p1  ORF type:complete len:207 (+),score=32.80 GHVU01150926.1:1792-2412(+)
MVVTAEEQEEQDYSGPSSSVSAGSSCIDDGVRGGGDVYLVVFVFTPPLWGRLCVGGCGHIEGRTDFEAARRAIDAVKRIAAAAAAAAGAGAAGGRAEVAGGRQGAAQSLERARCAEEEACSALIDARGDEAAAIRGLVNHRSRSYYAPPGDLGGGPLRGGIGRSGSEVGLQQPSYTRLGLRGYQYSSHTQPRSDGDYTGLEMKKLN